MKYLKFLLVGIFFGIVLVKSEAVSWYRIFEMFKFQSFHMYGIIGSAVVLGIIFVQVFKKIKLKSTEGKEIDFLPKEKSYTANILGGTIFGLGWALAGACPGPMYILVGTGAFTMLIVIVGALLGALAHGMLGKRLPH